MSDTDTVFWEQKCKFNSKKPRYNDNDIRNLTKIGCRYSRVQKFFKNNLYEVKNWAYSKNMLKKKMRRQQNKNDK